MTVKIKNKPLFLISKFYILQLHYQNKKSMDKRKIIYAFIDSQNLNLGTSRDVIKKGKTVYKGWKLDYKRFRVYLKDKYKIEKAYLFIGYKPGNEAMYTHLQNMGYICVFKPTLELTEGKTKGNVDAELVLHSMIEFKNFDRAIIVSGDGDFHCLIEYLIQNDKLEKVLVPNEFCYSSLFEHFSTSGNNILSFVSQLKDKLEYKKTK